MGILSVLLPFKRFYSNSVKLQYLLNVPQMHKTGHLLISLILVLCLSLSVHCIVFI